MQRRTGKRLGKEAVTTMEEGRPETTAAQEGSENWTRFVDLLQAAL